MIIKNKNGFSFQMFSIVAMLISIVFTVVFLFDSAEDSYYDKDFKLLKNSDSKNRIYNAADLYIDSYVNNFLKESQSNFIRKLVLDSENLNCIDDKRLILFDELSENGLCISEENIANYEKKYIDYVEYNLIDGLSKGMKFENLEVYSVKANEDNSKIIVSTSYTFEDIKVGGIRTTKKYEFDLSILNFEPLLNQLNSIFPEFGKGSGNAILSCATQNIEADICRVNYFLSKIPEDLKRNFNFEIENIQDNQDEIVTLEFMVHSKDNTPLLNFETIFKDSTPRGVVDYSASNHPSLENTINLKITELDNPPVNYVILYSYENFVSRSSFGTSRYDELISMLQNSEIPFEFENSYSSNYYSKDTSSLNLNLQIIDPKKDFSEGKRNIPIFQIYNFETKKYELLENGRTLHFMVFAVDKDYNYFTDDVLLKAASKNIQIDSISNALVIPSENVNVNNDLENTDSSFSFSINGFESEADDYFLYITKNRGNEKLRDNCELVNFDCNVKRFDYLSNSNSNYFVTSSNPTSSELYTQVLSTDISLNHNDYIEFFLIPYVGGKSTLESRTIDSKIKPRFDENNKPYFELVSETSTSEFIQPYSKEIQIKDNKAPSSSDINIIGLTASNNELNLQWSVPVNSDVVSLRASGRAYINDLEYDSIIWPQITLENTILNINGPYVRIELMEIEMSDSAGNFGIYDSTVSWP